METILAEATREANILVGFTVMALGAVLVLGALAFMLRRRK